MKKKKQHPITYEHIGQGLAWIFGVSIILFIFISAVSNWIPDEEIEDRFWICNSEDGRINNLLVKGDNNPRLWISNFVNGNRDIDFHCASQRIFSKD